jgi:hypothetical protein
VVPNQALYQAELRPAIAFLLAIIAFTRGLCVGSIRSASAPFRILPTGSRNNGATAPRDGVSFASISLGSDPLLADRITDTPSSMGDVAIVGVLSPQPHGTKTTAVTAGETASICQSPQTVMGLSGVLGFLGPARKSVQISTVTAGRDPHLSLMHREAPRLVIPSSGQAMARRTTHATPALTSTPRFGIDSDTICERGSTEPLTTELFSPDLEVVA